jgi:cytochrome P450
VCIGEQFAWMEGVLLIATIASQWKMRLAPGHKVETRPMVTLRPRYGMRMIVEAREHSTAAHDRSLETVEVSA